MKNSYGLNCPVARALDIVGEKWTLLILRDFFLHGNRRFQDLQESLQGVAPNTLSTRLKILENQQIVERQQYSASPPRFEYVLTKKGEGLGPVVKSLYDWGSKYTT